MDLVHVYTFDSMQKRCIPDPEHVRQLDHLRVLRHEKRRVRRERRVRLWKLLRLRRRPSGVARSPRRTAETRGGYV
jgi:hypothetical protein